MNAMEWIKIYEMLFYISLGITILGFGLAVYFFFRFRIPDLHAIMTGKARAETIKRMEEQNALTGSLRTPMAGTARSSYKRERGKPVPVIAQPNQAATARMDQPPAPEHESIYNRPDTSVLSSETPDTSVLVDDYDSVQETSVLNTEEEYPDFIVTESTLVIHTDEII